MGKAGRAACIFVPMALTIASFICAVLLQIAGWNTLNSYFYFQANLTDLRVDGSGSGSNPILSDAIGKIKTAGGISEIYNIHLWNYCYSNATDGSDTKCSGRKSQFAFDPIEIWGLETDNATTTLGDTSDNAIDNALDTVQGNYDEWSQELLGSSGRKALNAYKQVAKWMFIGYQVAFWTNLATIVIGLLAICSRWGSLFTWILSVVSTIFTVASVLTSTILFSAVVGALGEVMEPYGIELTLGRKALIVSWLNAALTLGATFFWVLSICCCSGRSNPHHKSNKGGLWNAEPKGQGYNDGGFVVDRRGRGLKAEKPGGGYARVASPYAGAQENNDQVPLHDYGQPNPYASQQQQNGYEPYRHS